MNIGSPDGIRSFDPFRLADLEHRMWVAYYLRRWPRLLAASARLLRLGFGTNLPRILQGAWLMLRAVQLWAPFPDNDPDGAQARMHELYALVRLRFGEPADPAQAASLEIGEIDNHTVSVREGPQRRREIGIQQAPDHEVFGRAIV